LADWPVDTLRGVTTWEAVRWLHLLSMAFFVGGQLFLAACVLPVMRGDRPRLQAVARRFGWGTLGALAVLLATGSAMASHFGDWGSGTLHAKLALVALTGVLVVVHMRRPGDHWMEGLVFVLSLAIVWLGVALAH
jgi:putative copper export protein